MAEEEGLIVFQRGHGDDDNNDIWDDTALIEAYDKAISIMKSGLTKKTDGTPANALENSDLDKKRRKNRRKHKKKVKSKPQEGQRWNVGSHCRCIYTEDGQMYEATILSIDQEAGTCYVQYLGYGNEEEQNIKDLLPSAIQSQRTRRYTQSQSENDSMDWTSPGINPRTTTPTSHRKPQQLGPSSGWAWPPPPPTPPFSMGIPPPFSSLPPLFPSMPNMPSPWPGLSASAMPRLPSMPPPPPPVPAVSDDLLEADSDALSSMLMAWYMSGYHTGYYQGLKAGKKAKVSGQGHTQSSQNTSQKSETG